jgi:hypothetical protein
MTIKKVLQKNPGGAKFFRTFPDRPWGPPNLLYNVYRVFPGGRMRPGRDVDPSLLSSAEVRKQSRVIPLLSLRALVACKKGETYLSFQGQKQPGRFADLSPNTTSEVKNGWAILISHFTSSGRRQGQHFSLAVVNCSSWVK